MGELIYERLGERWIRTIHGPDVHPFYNDWPRAYFMRGEAPGPVALDRPDSGLECTPHHCVVQPGYLFVMGDNRDGSADSRVWGGVPNYYLRGTATVIWFSHDWTEPAPLRSRGDRETALVSNVYGRQRQPGSPRRPPRHADLTAWGVAAPHRRRGRGAARQSSPEAWLDNNLPADTSNRAASGPSRCGLVSRFRCNQGLAGSARAESDHPFDHRNEGFASCSN